jgi:hypothetical protein
MREHGRSKAELKGSRREWKRSQKEMKGVEGSGRGSKKIR